MRTFEGWCIWGLIQLESLVLTVVGVPVVAYLAYACRWELNVTAGRWDWAPRWAWVWGNDEDGSAGRGLVPSSWRAFKWSALRNPANNLRFIAGFSRPEGPYKVWYFKAFGRPMYFHIGFAPTKGWPVLSGGHV